MSAEPVACFMVPSVWDCWADGRPRVGAICWRRHDAPPEDPEPRPTPHLAVMTPAGLVCLDCPETGGTGHWDRQGDPPRVTVTPSLNVNHGEWHGWLTDGHLVT